VPDDHQQRKVRPLTRCGVNGTPYTRTPEVERQIASALAMDADQLIVRAQISSQTAPNYLREECLVYLIREYHRCGHRATVAALFEILLQRCERLLRRRLGSLDQTFSDAYQECLVELVSQTLILTSDRGDFLQVRFWTALNRLAISTFNRYREQQSCGASTLAIGAEPHDDQDAATGTVDLRDPALSIEDLAACRDALGAIPEPYRTAFVLCHYHRWPIKDATPGAPSISRYFNKTPRTINNYLHRAEQALRDWRGGPS
jgi:DNA-directed RNA polymerase specialized sigma24 family protein